MPIPLPQDFFGTELEPPQGILAYGKETTGLIKLFNNLLRVAIYASLVFAVINFIIAGIQYIGSSGNPEITKKASSKIWMSLLGLVVATSALVIAGVIGIVFYGNSTAIIYPVIYGP